MGEGFVVANHADGSVACLTMAEYRELVDNQGFTINRNAWYCLQVVDSSEAATKEQAIWKAALESIREPLELASKCLEEWLDDTDWEISDEQDAERSEYLHEVFTELKINSPLTGMVLLTNGDEEGDRDFLWVGKAAFDRDPERWGKDWRPFRQSGQNPDQLTLEL